MTELETTRLRLRPLTGADHDALYAIYADPEVRRGLITQPRSIEEFRIPFDQMLQLSSTLGMWAIIYKEHDCLIGRCGFYPSSEAPVGTPELAYLLSRSYWGQGLATEAARCCVHHAFSVRGWAEVVALVRLENLASARVLTKVGMERVGGVEIRGVPAHLYHATSTHAGQERELVRLPVGGSGSTPGQ